MISDWYVDEMRESTSAATKNATNAEPGRNAGAYRIRSATSEKRSNGGKATANRTPYVRWNSFAQAMRAPASPCRFTFGVRKTAWAAPSNARTDREMPIAPWRMPAASTPYSRSVEHLTNQIAYGARNVSGNSQAANCHIAGGS